MQRFHSLGPLVFAGGLAAVLFLPVSGPSPAQQGQGEALFHRAYYLEHEGGDLTQALEAYRRVAGDPQAKAELRELAGARARGLAEDLAASDLANLVPASTLFYAELSRPGEQLARLLDQLGLLGEAGRIARDRIAVSPLLIEGALGLRGAAVAVTELMPNGEPSGVVILHPGELGVLRGAIETFLPAGGEPLEPIGGHPAWSIDGKAVLCATSRLLVASTDARQIADVVGRLEGESFGSLGAEPRARQALGQERAGLLRFFLNAEPLKPMLRAQIQQAAQRDPGAAMAASLLDLESLQGVSGRIGVEEDGLSLELALDLAQGHRNLVFNLMRRPAVGRETLELVPQGAAFFVASAFNPAASVAPLQAGESGEVVTLLDFGRELFGNLIDAAIFGLPQSGSAAGLPDVACVMRVNDAERTRGLWSLVLGIAGGVPAAVERTGDAVLERYDVQGVPVFLGTRAGRVVLSPSRAALERSLAGDPRASVLSDGVFQRALDVLGRSPTLIVAACPGRCAVLARGFMPADEARAMEPYAALLQKTVVSLAVQHSDTRLALAARVSAIPDISGLVTQAARGWKQVQARPAHAQVAHETPEPRPATRVQKGDTR
jgi:hypothetical protein